MLARGGVLLLSAGVLLTGCARPGAVRAPCNDDRDCSSHQICVLGGCEAVSGLVDAGTTSPSLVEDAGDPGSSDAGLLVDAGPRLDGGPATDAGAIVDAGETDAGGPVDAGAVDASTEADAGADDSGPSPDAGGEVDAGPTWHASCAALLDAAPSAQSGWYTLEPAEGAALVDVFCEMSLFGGGWTRILALDATTGPACPGEWEWDEAPGGCRRASDTISSARFPVPIGSFSEVLGAALGVQYGTPDGFRAGTLEQPYVDGMSLTATGPDAAEAHVWTFAIGLTDDAAVEPLNHCPCAEGRMPAPFVGDNYFCDTAMSTGYPPHEWLEEPLWDDDATDGVCSAGSLVGAGRFFRASLPAGYTELRGRLMANQPRGNEDVGVRSLVLFVR